VGSTLLAILACLLWSTAFVGIKIGLRYATPLSFAGIRFMVSGLILVPFWWRRAPWGRGLAGQWFFVWQVAFFQTFLLYGLFYLGIARVPGALAAIVVGASPLITALVAHFRLSDEPLTRCKALSFTIGVAGVAVVSLGRTPWVSPTGLAECVGILLLLLASVSSAVGNIMVAKEKRNLDPILLTSAQIFLGGLLLFLVSLPLEGLPAVSPPAAYYGALFWLAALSAAAFSLWFVLLKRPGASVSQLNLWKFLIPVSGAGLSWLLLPEESPHLSALVGMAAIAFAIVFFHRSESVCPATGSGDVVAPGVRG